MYFHDEIQVIQCFTNVTFYEQNRYLGPSCEGTPHSVMLRKNETNFLGMLLNLAFLSQKITHFGIFVSVLSLFGKSQCRPSSHTPYLGKNFPRVCRKVPQLLALEGNLKGWYIRRLKHDSKIDQPIRMEI